MARAPMVTIRQIAREADVSIGTVSRVLRSEDQVLPETRDRVMEVARRLRYRPNLLMRSVRQGKSMNIGVMIPLDDAFDAQIVSGVHDGLCEAEYAPILLWNKWRGDMELKQIHRLVDRRVDGVILTPVDHHVTDEYFKEIWERGIPLITVDTELAWTHADFVGSKDELGAAQAAEHLLKLGHRRLGQLAGPQRSLNAQRRLQGFERAVTAAGASCFTVENDNFIQGVQKARQLLSGADRPSAVFCHTDWLANDVYKVAAELNLRIPEDLSVVGYAGIEFSQWMRPALTTVAQKPYEMGMAAAQLMIKRLTGKVATSPQRIRLDPELIVRQSTAAIGGIS